MRELVTSLARDIVRLAMAAAVVAAPVALLLSHVHTQYAISKAGYDIASVTREHRSLAEENKKLQIEAAVQGRTRRIEAVGKERFGLEPAQPRQITVIPITELAPERTEHASLTGM